MSNACVITVTTIIIIIIICYGCYYYQLQSDKCRAEEVIVTTDVDVPARVMEITKGKGAWAAINPIGGPASRDLPSCEYREASLKPCCSVHLLMGCLLCPTESVCFVVQSLYVLYYRVCVVCNTEFVWSVVHSLCDL